MSYKKPLLVEIYAEMILEDKPLTQESMFDLIPYLRKNGFPKIDFGGAIFQQSEREIPFFPGMSRVRCWNDVQTKLVQVSPGRLAVNKVIKTPGQYLGWQDFKDFFREVKGLVETCVGSLRLKSISLTTIDRFEVATQDYAMGKYLNTTGSFIPSWFQDSRETVDLTMGKGLVETEKFNRQVKIAVRNKTKVMDIRIESVFHDIIKNDVMNTIEALHGESGQTFESLITDVTRQQVMGGMK